MCETSRAPGARLSRARVSTIGRLLVAVAVLLGAAACAPATAEPDQANGGDSVTAQTPTMLATETTGATRATAVAPTGTTGALDAETPVPGAATRPAGEIDSFSACVAAGFPVMESYPRQCRTPDGRTFTEDIGNEMALADVITIDSPRPGASVSSPIEIRGQARGTWYFEASFSIDLVSGDEVLGSAAAVAQGDWMTEDFVPFEATLEFEVEASQSATLVLRKANPSGMPENDAALQVPILLNAPPISEE